MDQDSLPPENRRILVIDDEPEIRAAYRRFLGPEAEKGGSIVSSRLRAAKAATGWPASPDEEGNPQFEITEADSGDRALEIMRSELASGRRFAAAIVDVRMPGKLDGLQFVQEAWRLDRDLLVVIATAYQDRSVNRIAQMFGSEYADQWDYLSKPFTSGEIVQKARQMVSSWNRHAREKAYLERIRRHQEQLLAQERLAAVGRLARGVGHDLGNIMQTIMAQLDSMGADPKREAAIEAVELGAAVCRNLMTFATGEQAVNGALAIRLSGAFEKAQRLLRHELKKKAIKLEVSLAPEATVRANESRLVQVFLNLLLNAIHAMSDGGKLTVTIAGGGKGGTQVEIRDDGAGIKPEHLPRVFDPLFTTKGVEGNGIGLGVCKSIVEEYGGSIAIESKPGRGTAVRITFP
jgi:signal transduction histidine kinase